MRIHLSCCVWTIPRVHELSLKISSLRGETNTREERKQSMEEANHWKVGMLDTCQDRLVLSCELAGPMSVVQWRTLNQYRWCSLRQSSPSKSTMMRLTIKDEIHSSRSTLRGTRSSHSSLSANVAVATAVSFETRMVMVTSCWVATSVGDEWTGGDSIEIVMVSSTMVVMTTVFDSIQYR